METYVPIDNAPYLAIMDCKVATAATSATTHLDVGPGMCRDQSNTYDLNIGNYGGIYSGVSADTTTNINATVTGINGIDTGSLAANKIYYVYVVADTVSNNTTGAMISLAAPSVGPLMPTGYNAYRHVGFVMTNGSSQFYPMFITGNQNARTLFYDNPVATNITAGTSTSFAAATLTNLVPLVNPNPVYLNVALTPGAASRTVTLQSGSATSGGNQAVITGQVTSVVVTQQIKLLSTVNSTTASVNYKVSNSDSSVAINVAGFDYYI